MKNFFPATLLYFKGRRDPAKRDKKFKKPFSKILFSAIVLAAVVFVLFLFSRTTLGEQLYVILADFFSDKSVQLLLINEKTYRSGINNIGDIVGIFDGTHEFSPAEKSGFDIVKIQGISRQQTEAALQAKLSNFEGLSEEQKNQLYTQPKYQFRVEDKTKTDITQMVESNVKRK